MVDKQLVSALDHLPQCHVSVALALETAVAARKAAAMSSTLSRAHRSELSGARLLRAEALILALRDTLCALDRELAAARRAAGAVVAVSTAASRPRPAAWDWPGDTWFADRAKALCARLEEVRVARECVRVKLDVAVHGDGGVGESYDSLVRHVGVAVAELSQVWRRVDSFVQEWKDVAVVFTQGVGQSASLMPSS